jgi:hypothetical protein
MIMTIYECQDIIRQIEERADANYGEVSDDDMQLLVEAQTSSMEKLGKLVGCIKHFEYFVDACEAEIKKTQEKKKSIEKRLDNIKRFMLPYLEQHGTVTVGTNKIGIRESKAVILAEGFDNPIYCKTVTEVKPDKNLIKDSIQNGIEVKGAMLETRKHVVIR